MVCRLHVARFYRKILPNQIYRWTVRPTCIHEFRYKMLFVVTFKFDSIFMSVCEERWDPGEKVNLVNTKQTILKQITGHSSVCACPMSPSMLFGFYSVIVDRLISELGLQHKLCLRTIKPPCNGQWTFVAGWTDASYPLVFDFDLLCTLYCRLPLRKNAERQFADQFWVHLYCDECASHTMYDVGTRTMSIETYIFHEGQIKSKWNEWHWHGMAWHG